MGRGHGRGSEGTPPAVPLAHIDREQSSGTPPAEPLSPVQDEQSRAAAPPAEDVAARRTSTRAP